MDEHHAALAEHAAVAVVHAVDGGVVLVVRAHGHQREHALIGPARAGAVHRRVAGHGMGEERGLAGGRVPDALAGGVAQPKAAGRGDAGVEILEIVKHLGNQIAHPRIVLDQPQPGNAAALGTGSGQRGRRQARDNRRFGQQQLGRRRVDASGQMHHAHRILHRHALHAAGLPIDLGAPQAGQYQRLASVHQMAAVELGRHMHRQIALAQPAPGGIGVGRGRGEVAAQREEHAAAAVQHQPYRFDGVDAVGARRLEAEHLLQPVEQRGRRLFPDAHAAVALHVAVAAHRAGARAFTPQVAAQQQQVDQHLYGGHRMRVLGDAHAPADDAALRADVDLAGGAQLRFAQAGLARQHFPAFGLQVCGQGLEARGVLGNEGVVENPAARGLLLEHMLHHALDRGQIAAGAHLEVMRADRRGAHGRHLELALRVLETLQAALVQRVEADDARAALVRRAQLAQHARVVGARVLAEDEDRVGMLEVLECHRALAHADLRAHAVAAGLVAHVRAVGEIVGAVLAHEQLVEKGGLVAGATRGIEDRLVGVGQRLQLRGNQGKGRIPFDGQVAIGLRVIAHGMRQAPLVF